MPARPNTVDATSPERLWQIITREHRGVLATVGADGTPHLTNMHYLVDPSRRLIRMSTTTDRLKSRNLQRDPRAALHVDGPDWFNYAVAAGTVTLAVAREPGDAAIDELYEVHHALGAVSSRDGFDAEMLANHRMVARLEVARLYGQVRDRE